MEKTRKNCGILLRELFLCSRFFAALGVSALIFSGCCSAPPEKKAHTPDVGAELTRSFCRNDAGHFVSCLPENVKKDFGEKEFVSSRKKVCNQLGTPRKSCFLGKLEHPFFDVRLWKITFERTDGSGNPVMQDALFQVVCGKDAGSDQVVSFGFL